MARTTEVSVRPTLDQARRRVLGLATGLEAEHIDATALRAMAHELDAVAHRIRWLADVVSEAPCHR